MTYSEISQLFIDFKNKNDCKEYTNWKLVFTGSAIVARCDVSQFKDRQVKTFLDVYEPTTKGYVSSKWKKNGLRNMPNTELTEELFNKISSVIQTDSPNYFIPESARGLNVANVLADHLRNSDPYDRQ